MNDFKEYKHHKNYRALLLLRYQFTLLSVDRDDDSNRWKVKQWASYAFVEYYNEYHNNRGSDIVISADEMRYLNEVYKWVKKRVDDISQNVEWSEQELLTYSNSDVAQSKAKQNYPPYQFSIAKLHKIK